MSSELIKTIEAQGKLIGELRSENETLKLEVKRLRDQYDLKLRNHTK